MNEEPGRYRITKTYVTDPARNVLMIDVQLRVADRARSSGSTLVYDPALGNDHEDDVAEPSRAVLLARDTGSPVASAVAGRPAFARTSSTGSGGDLVQTAQTSLTGLSGSQSLTVALGFGETSGAAQYRRERLARRRLRRDAAPRTSPAGTRYLAGLKSPPASADATLYHASVMTLAAHEDKTYRGGYIASPTMPWVWGTGLENPSGAYHLVWSRDLYQIATALIAAGDTAGANRAVDYLFLRQQKPDGSFPQNSTVDGTPHWGNLQLDEVALPIVLAWQLGRTDAALYRDHIKKAADFLVSFPDAPFTPQERWENQSGYSPGTIASEIAGLVCAADIARRERRRRVGRPLSSAPPTTGRSASTAGPPRPTARTRRGRTTCG